MVSDATLLSVKHQSTRPTWATLLMNSSRNNINCRPEEWALEALDTNNSNNINSSSNSNNNNSKTITTIMAAGEMSL
jgi:hypothetical protein